MRQYWGWRQDENDHGGGKKPKIVPTIPVLHPKRHSAITENEPRPSIKDNFEHGTQHQACDTSLAGDAPKQNINIRTSTGFTVFYHALRLKIATIDHRLSFPSTPAYPAACQNSHMYDLCASLSSHAARSPIRDQSLSLPSRHHIAALWRSFIPYDKTHLLWMVTLAAKILVLSYAQGIPWV